ncbi:MAG TPA: CBS domain-containing protein [Pyrinomonadaceae bacterium]|nr:CBS domain-containing protein [Acidobacteriota bacterium]HQZ96859.1 CBS domain-containing protein [Pyrinomonadaceae bacterium]
MGDKKVTSEYDDTQMRAFTLGVLNDLQAIELMLDGGMFEEDVRRIGAEQEMFLVDSSMHPAPLAMKIIDDAKDGRLTTEIGLFNLEANLTPREFGGNCLRLMEDELNETLDIVRRSAAKFGGGVVLAGILPTIQQSDLTIENLTPNPRYHEINRIVTQLHGDNRVIHIKGLDELQLTLQNTYIEFCNTSFQVHLQVGISEFVRYYNWAQAISGPVLASAVNSPFLLNHRLWHETRLAVFRQSTDTRSLTHKQRNQKPRVNFGDRWVENSILEVLREDAIRFRILLTQAVEENSLKVLADGGIPSLSAWRLHNGTIWRWNRPCYGVVNGKPGLRIEARFLPAGPTVADEMANSAFFLGLMTELPEEFGDISKLMTFDDARNNFYNAARYGLNGQIKGLDGQSRRVGRIILEELLPRARRGLIRAGVDDVDSQRLLDIIETRVTQEKSGAKWMLDSYEAMDKRAKPNVRLRTLTAAMKAHQEQSSEAMHTWKLADIPSDSEWIDNYKTVEQFMAVDLYTVRPDDIIDLAASLMHWKHVRHVPVEDDAGRLIGIVSHRDLIELMANGKCLATGPIIIRDVMKTNLITVTPETHTLDALELMRENNIGCLPVLRDDRLVGLVTAYDFLTVSAKLFEEKLSAVISTDERGAQDEKP